MGTSMKTIKLVITLLFFLGVPNSYAYEILSKEDAKQTFAKSLDEWVAATKSLSASGMGKVLELDKYTITMVVPVSQSILKVTPQYDASNIKRPIKVYVGVEQNKEFSKMTIAMGEEGMKGLVKKWYEQMLPEFTLMTEFDTTEGIVQINFTLFESGSNLVIDAVGRETSGCWQKCIKK
jgi:hypothetical protein